MQISAKRKIVVRQTKYEDAKAIQEIVSKTYPDVATYPESALHAHINHFPEGQIVVEYEGKIVGFCISFIISEKEVLVDHTWSEITGNCYASRHDSHGDILYGMDICVDSDYRGKKVGERLYNERRKLCQKLKLKGIVFGARIPGFSKKKKNYPLLKNT